MNTSHHARADESIGGLLFGALSGEFISTAVGQGAAMAVDTVEFFGDLRTDRARDQWANGLSL